MATGKEGQKPFGSFFFLFLIILVFYFFMIRPQMKKQKDLKSFRSSLKKGDKVVTTGGIYGKITEIKEQIVIIEVAENIRMKLDKSAVLKEPADIPGQK